MHSRRFALAALLACLATLSMLLAMAGPALADSAGVSTDPTGAHVVLAHDKSWVEVGRPRSGSSPGSGHSSGCQRRWVPTEVTVYLRKGWRPNDYTTVPMPPPPGPDYRAYFVYCGDEYVTSVWLLPSQFTANGDGDLRALADEMIRDLPYPAATIGTSPATRGLTGLDTWLWVGGYTGAPLHDEVSGWGIGVEVEAVPAQVTWSYGDGSPAAPGSLGRAFPARSDVVHTFETRSDAVGFTLRAELTLATRFRVDGGPWESLDPVLRAATRAYPVSESRSVLVPGP
ncbi:MAG TPA: hypothetical protein VIC35_07235 [Acidimicrobiia bacterium]|jgi:hypothetical protein